MSKQKMEKMPPIPVGDEAEEYLKFKGKRTAKIYRTAYRVFIKSYQKRHGEDTGFDHFLDRIFENMRLPRREQKRIAEGELVEFIDDVLEQGRANNTVRLYFSAVQNFLKFKNVQISAKWVGNLPKSVSKKVNHKQQWKLSQVKEFVETATIFRDKAIIITLFQSGIGVGELCSLDYGDVEKELNEGTLPLMIDVVRQKTENPYKTFLGADAVKYLRIYLETRRDLKPKSPLFTKHGTDNRRVTVGLIQAKFREIAKELPFIDTEEGGYNPARPHSLRSGFRSRLTGKMDGDLIEFFMGHKLPATKTAYLNIPDDELRELYAQFEHELSIETTSKNVLMGIDAKTSKIDSEAKKEIKVLKGITGDLIEKLGRVEAFIEMLGYDIEPMTGQVIYNPEKDQRR